MVVSLDLLSSVRAYVNGESLWAKGQQTAVHVLDRYIETGDAQYFDRFLEAIAVPLGDRSARLAMEGLVLDEAAARRGLIAGGNAPEDVPRLIRLFRYFGDFSYVRDAIGVWRETDGPLLELDAIGRAIHETLSQRPATAEERRLWHEEADAVDARLTPMAAEFSFYLSAGARWVQSLLVVFNLGAAGGLIFVGMVATRTLLRQRQKAEAALLREQTRASITLASIGDAVFTIDDLGCMRYMNGPAETLIGWDSRDAQHMPVIELFRLFENDAPVEGGELVGLLLSGAPVSATALELERKDKTRVAVSLVATPLRNEHGVTTGAVLVFHDMTREKQFVADLSWQASHDALTGLVNRREFDVRLRRALQRLEEQGGLHALLYIDLDQFKLVNDTCGHQAGDQLLCQASRLLQNCLRERDTLARLGGDEFGVLLEYCGPEDAMQIAEKLRRSIEELHFASGGRSFTINASIGLVGLEPGLFLPEEAMRAADLACYLAKEKGRNRVQIYSAQDSELSLRFDEMLRVQQLHEALKEHRFRLYEQRVVPVGTEVREAARVELLLRLVDATGKVIPPGAFLPAAERYGLMPQIDRWVVQNAFAMLAERRQHGCEPIASCAINLSGVTIGDADFLGFVRERLLEHRIDPATICFEVTETVAVSNMGEAERFIEELQGLGCRFALDDFGAGMSSFAYLRRLPVDYVKIDGSFVKDMLADSINYAMVEMISRLAHLMGKYTIAEFVESPEILQVLGGLGVDYAQGYAIGKPRPFVAHLSEELPQED